MLSPQDTQVMGRWVKAVMASVAESRRRQISFFIPDKFSHEIYENSLYRRRDPRFLGHFAALAPDHPPGFCDQCAADALDRPPCQRSGPALRDYPRLLRGAAADDRCYDLRRDPTMGRVG